MAIESFHETSISQFPWININKYLPAKNNNQIKKPLKHKIQQKMQAISCVITYHCVFTENI